MNTNNNVEEIRYQEAVKRVKKIKGFYSHLMVYVVINIMIFIFNVQHLENGENYFQMKNFFTAFFWGFGIVAHALAVFLPNKILSKEWEERKIKEFMEKEKREKWE